MSAASPESWRPAVVRPAALTKPFRSSSPTYSGKPELLVDPVCVDTDLLSFGFARLPNHLLKHPPIILRHLFPCLQQQLHVGGRPLSPRLGCLRPPRRLG